MKIAFFLAAMGSLTLVTGLPLHQPKYSSREAQEEYLREHGSYDNCTYGNATVDSLEANEGWSLFEGDIIVRVKDTGSRDSEEQLPADAVELLFWKAVRCFQRKSGLPETGVVSEETRKEMETPSKVPSSDAHSRRKRFVLAGKWEKLHLTYHIENYNVNRTITNITDQDFRSTIQRAIKLWTDVSGLTVTEKNTTTADIQIGFYAKDHNCGFLFDGQGGDIGHAFFPDDGRIHFDADEPWSLYTRGGKWMNTNLTYYIKNYDINLTISNITEQDIRSTIQQAMKFWTDVSGLTVTEKNSTRADIKIGFYAKDHKDPFPFDGQGGTLAHAFYPDDGDIHFDADEPWSLYADEDLLRVAIHEFGHAIGILHSEDKDSVMIPEAANFNPNRKLAKDDILAVRSLYGLPRDHLFKTVLKYFNSKR